MADKDNLKEDVYKDMPEDVYLMMFCFFTSTLLSVCLFIYMVTTPEPLYSLIALVPVFVIIGFSIAYTINWNRLRQIVICDDKTVRRMGYWIGFEESINMADVLEVKYVLLSDGEFYCIDDGKHKTNTPTNKNSTIFIPYCQKGYEFIERHFPGKVPPYHSHDWAEMVENNEKKKYRSKKHVFDDFDDSDKD